ncbi:AMP-binding protein [Lichenicola cladoniae]|uniref:AMP-binding protein n=1 Tax=Lichenicola cladoniae TaxID=1484109 RepID=UPI0023B84A01|nr:AMP-binding protein [Lichenicola cladoniae]
MQGVVPFPPDVAERYRALGYWRDRPLRAAFSEWCAQYAERVAVRDAERALTYAELDAKAQNLALNLLDLGLEPRDRVLVQLPNVIEFAVLHFALQKIGVIPVMALPPHRYREMSFFADIS